MTQPEVALKFRLGAESPSVFLSSRSVQVLNENYCN